MPKYLVIRKFVITEEVEVIAENKYQAMEKCYDDHKDCKEVKQFEGDYEIDYREIKELE